MPTHILNVHSAALRACFCSMVFAANDSPLAGRSGKAVTGRVIGERLAAEAETSVSLRVRPVSDGVEKYEVQVSTLCPADIHKHWHLFVCSAACMT